MDTTTSFDPNCQQCVRLVHYLETIKSQHSDYWCKPVPAFGDQDAKLLIVGLAPGLHGANKTGRPFTGDDAGQLLYQTMHQYGFANRSASVSADDGLRLINCRITNAVKCLPPQNRPLSEEIAACNRFLAAELQCLHIGSVVLALGVVAHNAVLKALNLRLKDYPFSHGAMHQLPTNLKLKDSYHCSRYNTQTKRLTNAMFCEVFLDIRSMLKKKN